MTKPYRTPEAYEGGEEWIGRFVSRVSPRAYPELVIGLVFAASLVAGTAVTLPVLWLQWHAVTAVCAAVLSAAAVTALIVHQATEADGIPPTRYDTVVIAIGAALGALSAALLLTCLRWIQRQVDDAKRLEARGESIGKGS
jgi:ABC-type Fe3+-siderophore transport system permease subunit